MWRTTADDTTPLTWGFAGQGAGGNVRRMNPRPPENHQVSSCQFGGGREKGVRELRLGSGLNDDSEPIRRASHRMRRNSIKPHDPHPAVRGHSTDPVVLIADGLGCRETT